MGVGKYSPTVSNSYAMDQSWWTRNGGGFGNGNNSDSDNDNDGFDSYGYSEDGSGPDRLGNTEDEYASSYDVDTESGDLYFYLYENAESEWGGKLLGDLNEFVNIHSIIKDNNLDYKKYQLHQNAFLSSDVFKEKDSDKFVSNDLLLRGFIHNSKVDSFLKVYDNCVNPKPEKQKRKIKQEHNDYF